MSIIFRIGEGALRILTEWKPVSFHLILSFLQTSPICGDTETTVIRTQSITGICIQGRSGSVGIRNILMMLLFTF